VKLKKRLSLVIVVCLITACMSSPFAYAQSGDSSPVTAGEFAAVISEATGMELAVDGKTVSREDAVVAIAEALDVSGPVEAVYSDTASLSAESQAAISVLSQAGILYGYPDGKFRPEKDLTVWQADVLAERLSKVLSTEYVDGIIQTTNFGSLIGYEDEKDQAYVWLDVPYGKAPVGDLRWKAPEYPDAWDGVRDATTSGNLGLQYSSGKLSGSEDCLNLDLYRPNNDETNLPILVFIHGGNNQTGKSGSLNGAYLASQENCIVISTNFRLGPLGFNCLPALKTGDPLEDSGNYTMLDIAKSLDWVKENAASFGGDGNNITISGYSAGGRNVMAMLLSPIYEGKFQKALAISGGMTTSKMEDSIKVYANAFAPLVVEDGVKATKEEAYEWLMTDSKAVRDYLYGLSADRIAPLMSGADVRMAPFPHLFEDGYVIPKGGFDANSYPIDVPLMMTTSSNEFSRFGLAAAHIKDRVKDGTIYTDPASMAEAKFITNYGSKLYGLFNAQESAERMFDAYDGDIYTCWTAWGNDPAIVGEKMATELGSFHGLIFPLITGSRMLSSGATYPEPFQTEGFLDLSSQFMDYLGNFLHTGNPNGDGLTTWEKWTSATDGANLVLDADASKAKIYMADAELDYEEILKQMDADHTISDETKDTIIKTNLNSRWFSARLDEYYGNESLWID